MQLHRGCVHQEELGNMTPCRKCRPVTNHLIPTQQLIHLMRVAIKLLPMDEVLADFEATNNVRLERMAFPRPDDPPAFPVAGMMDVRVTTFREDGVRRIYQLIKQGQGHELKLMQQTPPEFQ